jgi:polysaccharide biosynthesis transport protein
MDSTDYSLGLKQYWHILQRRWLVAAAVFACTLSILPLVLSQKEYTYSAEGKVLIKKISPTLSLTGLDRDLGQIVPLENQGSPLDTETEVITSVPIIQQTIDRLHLKDELGKPLKLGQFLENLSVSKVKAADILKISYQDSDPKTAAATVNTLIDLYLENNARVNRAEATAARKFIEQQIPQAEAAMRQVEIELREFKENNNVVALSEEASRAVNVTADLQQNMADVQAQVANLETQAIAVRNQLGMNPEQAMAVTALSQSTGVQEVLIQLQAVESQLAVEQTRLTANHPTILELQGKAVALKAVLQERAIEVLGTQPAAPDVKTFSPSPSQASAGDLQQKLAADLLQIEATRQGLSSQLVELSNIERLHRQRSSTLPQLEQQQRELERRLEAAQSIYSRLLEKLQEAQAAESQKIGNARMISPALVPDKPLPSNKGLLLVAGTMLGGAMAIATALVLDAADTTIHTSAQAKALFGWTVLGQIPQYRSPAGFWAGLLTGKLPWKSDRQLHSKPESPIVFPIEAAVPASQMYRLLRANLQALHAEGSLRTIVVASAVPQEGKSTVCANLAVALSHVGCRVLLVDANLQHSTQHQLWHLTHDVGLSHVLAKGLAPELAIDSVRPNLDVLFAGNWSDPSVDWLDSQEMMLLLHECSSKYDLTIVDTGATTVVADALILSAIVDGVLVVVRPGVGDRDSAEQLKEQLSQSARRILGLVVNGSR